MVVSLLAYLATAIIVNRLGHVAEQGLLIAAAVAIAASIVFSSYRALVARCVSIALTALVLSLVAHFYADDFEYHYVWLYSASSLATDTHLATNAR